jgi:plasmid stabilization system protein ParE
VSYRVVVTRMAREEIADAVRWIDERSPNAAIRWLDGIEQAITGLNEFPTRCAIAPETDTIGIEIRHQIYGKRAGRYRILFVVRGDAVHVIHVRHGARDVMQPDDVELPPRDVS